MKPVIFAALAFALPAVAAPANTTANHSYTNSEVYGLTLQDRVDCSATEPVSIQVRNAVGEMDSLSFDDAVEMFIFLEGQEGVCGSLADQASLLVSLSQSDPTAFMAELGLTNRIDEKKLAEGMGGSGRNATGPSNTSFDILQDGTPPPASSSVKTTSDYSS